MIGSTTFYLGGDVAALGWGIPVMVSHGRLRDRVTLPKATAPWVCDSRGFTELSQHGRWTFGPEEYATALRRYARDIGRLAWASPQDWMCEDVIINGGWIGKQKVPGTHLDVAEHQQRTIESVVTLRGLLDGEVHVIPVLQGRTITDYHRHVADYLAAGIDLRTEPTVGLGSVCRRQSSLEISLIVESLEATGISLHGFGVKTDGLAAYGPLLTSADSFAWSFGGRRQVGLCPHGLVKWEQNCPERARQWRDRVLDRLAAAHLKPRQLGLFVGGAA